MRRRRHGSRKLSDRSGIARSVVGGEAQRPKRHQIRQSHGNRLRGEHRHRRRVTDEPERSADDNSGYQRDKSGNCNVVRERTNGQTHDATGGRHEYEKVDERERNGRPQCDAGESEAADERDAENGVGGDLGD